MIERFELIVATVKHETPVTIRMRLLLKDLLRRYGFRCKSVRPIEVGTNTRSKAEKRGTQTRSRQK